MSMPTKLRCIALALVIGLTSGLLGGRGPGLADLAGLADPPADAVLHAGGDGLPLLTYQELEWDPETWVGRPLRLHVQFHALLEDWNPYLTRFGAQDHLAFTAWSDEQRAWIQAEYDHPRLRLFARQGGSVADLLADARPHERYEAICIVREIFGGRPWAEVIAFERLPQEVPEGSVLHAIRGIEFMEKRAWTLAAAQFERSLAAPLPTASKQEFERLVEYCKTQRDSTENRVYRTHFKGLEKN